MRNQTAEQLKEDIVFTAQVRGRECTFHTTWGIFSPKKVDDGSYLLLHSVAVEPTYDVLDLGSGYGALGIGLAHEVPQGTVTLVDSNYKAIEFAQKNIALNGVKNAEALTSFGLEKLSAEKKFDVVISNLPANVGREMLYILLSDARDHLKPGGKIYVVTIAGLRHFIQTNLEKVFGNFKKVRQEHGYSVASAVKE